MESELGRSYEIFGIALNPIQRALTRRSRLSSFASTRAELVFPCEREWAPVRVVALRLWLRPLPERRLRFTPFVPPFLAPGDSELGEVLANLSKLTGAGESTNHPSQVSRR